MDEELLLDAEVLGGLAVILPVLLEALHLTESRLGELDELGGLHEAGVDRDGLAIGGNDPERGEGLDLVFLGRLDVLGLLGVEL